MKKFFAVILSFALIFATIAIPSPAWAEGEVVDSGSINENMSWAVESLGDGGYKLTISGTGIVNGYEYGLEPWSTYRNGIRILVLEDGITELGSGTFYSYPSLENVCLADSVATLGDYAFLGCSALKTINFPDTLTSIGYMTFSECSALTEVAIPDSVTILGQYAFSQCTALKSAYIGDGVTEIKQYLFQNCHSLETVSMSGDVTTIGRYAFEGCSSLKTINLPETLTKIYGSAFKECSSLTDVAIPNSVTEIGSGAFSSCTSLRTLSIGYGVAELNNVFPNCTNLTDVTIPMVSVASGYSFQGCDKLKNIIYYGTNPDWNTIHWGDFKPDLDDVTRYDVKIPNAQYTGEPVRPAVSIKQGSSVLNQDADYTVSFGDPTIEVGSTCEAMVTFVGDYEELLPVTYRYYVVSEHLWGPWYYVEDTDRHAHECNDCGLIETEDCDYEEVLSYYEDGMMHRCYQCRLCKHEKVVVEPLVTRIYGDNRYETALMISEVYMELSGISQLDNIVVATGMEFPDALSGSYLSIAKKAPIILVNHQERFQTAALNYINTKVKPGGNVYLLGGTGVISEDFENAVKGSGFNVIRCAGAGRYETNIEILEQVGVGSELLVCSGRDFPDAATASSTGKAILLVNGSHLTEEQKTYLESIGPKDIYIIGGIGVVSPELSEELAAYDNDGYAWRVSGSDRAVTAMFVAQQFFPEEVSRVVFASGANFPDCIAGGLLANKLKAPIIYAGDARTYTDNARAYYIGSGASGAYALGGPAVVSDYFLKIALGFS